MSYNSFVTPKGTTIIPATYHRGKHIRNSVEYYAKAQQIRLDQALAVQGVDLIIWNKVLPKRFCTCQNVNSSIYNNTNSVQDVEIISNSDFKIDNKKEVSKTLEVSGLSNLDSLLDEIYTNDPEISAPEKSKNSDQSLIEQSLLKQKQNLKIEKNELVNCPICFSLKYVDVYQPYQGKRIILDLSDFYNKTFFRVNLNTETAPFSLEFQDTTSYIEYDIEIPKYFNPQSIKILNFQNKADNLQILFKASDMLNFQPLTLENLNLRKGYQNKLKIRIIPHTNTQLKIKKLPFIFTHAEIVFTYQDHLEKADMPLLNIPEQILYQELFTRSHFVLSSRVERLSRGDLINDKRYGLLWEVIDLTKNYTEGKKLIALEADCRVVQNSEKLFNLAIFPTVFSPVTTNFDSLETTSRY